MLRSARAVGQLADEVPLIREQLEQVADDARRAFSRVEDAATAATTALVVVAVVGVVALLLSTIVLTFVRRQPL